MSTSRKRVRHAIMPAEVGERVKVTTEKLERSQMAVEVEIEPEMLEHSMERAYRRLANRTNIPGFRRGKAPRFMVERYLGKAALLEEALDLLVPEAYNKALEEQAIPAFGQPHFEILQVEPSVTFKATVALRPTVELGEYKQLSFTLDPSEVTEEQVANVLEQLRYRYAPWESTERPVQFNDMVTLDIESIVEGKPFINDTSVPYLVSAESAVPIPGFAEQLEGTGKGDTREFTLTLPDDYPQAALAGKPVTFKVSLSEIKEKNLPDLNDEFAKSVGQGYDTLEALQAKVQEDLKADAARQTQRELEDHILEAVVGLAQVEYPDTLVEHEIDHLIQNDRSLPRDQQGRMDNYLQSIGKSPEEFREGYREEATRRVVRSLVMGKIAELEQIEVMPQEIDEEIENLVQDSGEQKEALRRLFTTAETRASLDRTLFRRKTMQRLVELTTKTSDAGAEAGSTTEQPSEVVEAGVAPKGRSRRKAES